MVPGSGPGKCLRAALLAASAAAVISACTTGTPGEKEGMTTLRHHNWWNFYQRGIALVATGDAANAREDFERFLDLRPGATYGFPKDLWRARTSAPAPQGVPIEVTLPMA